VRYAIGTALLLTGCAGLGTLFPAPTPTGAMQAGTPAPAILTFSAEANFAAGAAFDPGKPLSAAFRRIQGTMRTLAPKQYAIALSRIALVPATGSAMATGSQTILASDTLADSVVVDLSPDAPARDVATGSLLAGSYAGVVVDIYWVQCKIPVNGKDQTLRVYLTDDDFPGQKPFGKGKHHQGDVTFIDDAGTELGWVGTHGFSPATRSVPPATGSHFASAPDPRTGHDRGPFGNDDLWGKIPADKPYQVGQYFLAPLDLRAGASGRARMQLDIQKAWDYEDRDESETFNPAGGRDASEPGAAWNPVLPRFRFQ